MAGLGSDDNARFVIVDNELRTAESFDFEIKGNYRIRVRTTDADGLSFERTFTIDVIDLPEVANVTINNGGSQRSMVRTMQITFDHIVRFSGPAEQAFQVRKRGIVGGVVAIEAFVTQNTATKRLR